MTNQMENATGTPAHLTERSHLQPVIQAWKYYLNDQGRSPYTVKAFIADLNLLDTFLPPEETIGEITLKDLQNFSDWLTNERGVPCSPKSLARRITSVKSFFRWLQHSAVILIDPAEKLVQQSVTSPLPTILSHAQVQAALEAAATFREGDEPDARPYTLLKLLLETAIKKGECQSLGLKHLSVEDPQNAYIFVRYTNPRYRYKERKIPVSQAWVDSFNDYVQQYEPEESVFPWTARRMEYILEDITEAAGFEKRISFDMCRWTAAVMDLIEGFEPDKIRQKLGVSKIQFREVRRKLRKLALQQGFEVADETEEEEK